MIFKILQFFHLISYIAQYLKNIAFIGKIYLSHQKITVNGVLKDPKFDIQPVPQK